MAELETPFDKVLNQLISNCDCIKETDTYSRDVNQLINLISTMTCWKRSGCETFLKEERQEIFEPDINMRCGCDYGLTSLELYYDLIDKDTFKIQFQVRDGIKFEIFDVGEDLFSYDEIENKLWIDMSSFIATCGCCNPEITKLIVTYEAGYEQLPDCLLPVFCDYLDYVIEMNKCECGCDDCDEEIYNSESSEEQTSTFNVIQEHIIAVYRRQLEQMSLCKGAWTYWGKVI